MDVPAASVRGDVPFLDISRSLTREHVGCLPVVDIEDRVLGVVSESDLLAKAAVEASGHSPGAIGRLRERRLHDKARGETAETLMTTPAVTVYPGQSVAGRSHEEIEMARKDWMDGSRFGEVHGYDGGRLPAPALPPVALKPRGRVR